VGPSEAILARHAAQGLADRVLALAGELRAAGLSVSAAEVQDALRAVSQLPLAGREAVRQGLAATLLKDHSRRPTFDRLFDIFFSIGRGQVSGESSAFGPDDVVEALRDMDTDRLRRMAGDRVDRHTDLRPEARISEDSYVFRAMRGLNLDAILSRLQEEATDGKGLTALQRRVIREDLQERMDTFRHMVKDEVFSRLLERLGSEEMAARDRRPPPDEVDFLWARDSDLEGMRTALAPLARRLTRQLSRRRRQGRRGRLDVRRTLRGSLSTGGWSVEPRFRRPTAGRPDIVLLCDISGSMRAFAKFTLELTYALATQFQRVRSFVFVDALDEVTAMLQASGDLSTALERIDREANVTFVDGQSWYGHALEQFWGEAGRDLSPRTTVLVLGDARNNYRTAGVEFLQRVRERVRKVYWLNPEPRGHWNTGDSIMSAFQPACDEVFEVRNLQQLEEFASRVL
jgi:uncharacterized protein with von Willebrand factor type A (vWA) domain